MKQSCYNCNHRQFGFSTDPSWDAYDEVCHTEHGETSIFCTHGLSDKRIVEKLKRLGTQCSVWEKNEQTKDNKVS